MVRRWLLLLALTTAACVSAPEATRDGGVRCARDEDCNAGATCGRLKLCVLNFCAEDEVFRVCPDGRYPDAGVRGD
jgi:hypothetical protein